MDELLTSGEVAEKLKVCTRTITRLASKGKLPGSFKIGRQWRFSSSEIERITKSEEQTHGNQGNS